MYLDGGFDAAWALIGRVLQPRIDNVEPTGFYDFKTRFQEMALARLKQQPTYRVIAEVGPDHDKRFVVAVVLAGDEWARAEGRSKKEAEQHAAAAAAFKLESEMMTPSR